MSNIKRDQLIADKLAEGLSLSDIQKELSKTLNLDMTYLDLRLLVADLEVDWKKIDPQPEVIEEPEEDVEEEVIEGCKVTVSKLVRPGMHMSGDVVFPSGIKAEWYLTQVGQLGLNPQNEDDKPTPEDIKEFQMELQKILGSMGTI